MNEELARQLDTLGDRMTAGLELRHESEVDRALLIALRERRFHRRVGWGVLSACAASGLLAATLVWVSWPTRRHIDDTPTVIADMPRIQSRPPALGDLTRENLGPNSTVTLDGLRLGDPHERRDIPDSPLQLPDLPTRGAERGKPLPRIDPNTPDGEPPKKRIDP